MSTPKDNRLFVTMDEAMSIAKQYLKAGLVPMLHGSPGAGKSESFKKLAEDAGLFFIDIRLIGYDPCDLSGFPSPNKETKRMEFLPTDEIPLVGDPIPNGYKGWFILFDELPAASIATQTSAYKVILDKMVGNHKIHPAVFMAAAGNFTTDRAHANKMSTAMQSRLGHILVKSDLLGWTRHAQKHDFDHRVIAFANFLGECNRFKPNHDDITFLCERTLEMLSKTIADLPEVGVKDLPMVAGLIGLGDARAFTTFCEVYKDLPDVNTIIAKPETTKIPEDLATLWALTGMLAKHTTKSNIDSIIVYLLRLPIEYQILALRGVINKDNSLIQHPEVNKWSVKNAMLM